MPLFLALILLAASPQLPARDRPLPAASGTGAIAGRVIDAETGEPIAGAMVMIGTLSQAAEMPRLETDARGAFRRDGLPPGGYIIVVEPPELHATHVIQIVNSDMAAIVAGNLKPSVTLKDGEVRDDLVIKLERSLAIDGRVVDETGEPMGEIQVMAESGDPGKLFGMGGGPARTDDRGQFRVFGLLAGTYRVCATPSGFGSQGFAPAGIEASERRYVKTCYPSAPEGGGERVALRNAATPMLTIVMQRVRSFTVSGRVTSESGARNFSVQMQRHTQGLQMGGDMPIRVEVRDDTFVARGVPPGDYRLTARARKELGEPAGSVRTELARQIVRVEATDVTGLEVTTTAGATVAGRIVPEAPLPAGTKLRVQQAMLLRISDFMESATPKPVRDDLTFELSGIHAPMLFDVTGLPEGWVVSAVRYRGADITHVTTELATTRDPAELEIVVSPHSARVVARAVDEKGQPAMGGLVLLLSAKGDRVVMHQLFGDAEAKALDGTNQLPPLAPGEYLAVAVAIGDLMQLAINPARVADLRALGEPVTLKAGERRTLDVRLRPLPEVR